MSHPTESELCSTLKTITIGLEYPQIKIIFDRRKKASAVTTGTVEVEVSYNRELVRLSIGEAVLKQQWRSTHIADHPSRYVMPTRYAHHIRLFGTPVQYLESLRLEAKVHGGYRHTYIFRAFHLAVDKVLRLCDK